MKPTLKGNKYCTPSIKTKSTCYSKQNLVKMTKKWNRNYKHKIKHTKHKSKMELWHNLDRKMKLLCKNEWCWSRYLIDLKNRFRPPRPTKWNQKPDEWLDTNNIENVMEQYEKAHNDFVFIGAVPLDFNLKTNTGRCMVDDLCKINIELLQKKGIKKIGIVFNLDYHDEPGSHWTAMFIDSNRKGIYYFDSYGQEPEKEILVLIEKLKNQYKKINIKMKEQINNIRHQYKNSECGVYSLHFLITMLTKKTRFRTFCNNIIEDDEILKYRKIYFLE